MPISHSYWKSPAFLLTKTITHKVFTFKRNVRRIKPSGESVRTLFEVPNLEYKGRLSVLYSSPETFRLSSCPRDRRAKEGTPLPPRPPISPSGSQAWLKNLRHRAAELQRRPSASFVLDLGVERLRRHWLSSPSSSLSHLGNLRQKSLAVPPAQGSPAETAEVGRPRWEARPIRRHFHRERARQPRPFPPSRPTKCPTFPCSLRSPSGGAVTSPRPSKSVLGSLGAKKYKEGEGREAEVAAPPYPKWRRPNQQGKRGNAG